MALIKLNAETYKDLVNEYKKIIDDAAKAEKLGSQLAWHQFFLKKVGTPQGYAYYSKVTGIKSPTDYLPNARFELTKKLVKEANADIKNGIDKKTLLAEKIYKGKRDYGGISQSPSQKKISDYVTANLNKPADRINKAYKIIVEGGDRPWTKSIYGQIKDLTGIVATPRKKQTLEKIPEYNKNKGLYNKMGGPAFMKQIKNQNLTFDQAKEVASLKENTKVRGGSSSLGSVKGYVPEMNAMKFARDAWERNKGSVSPEGTKIEFYRPNGKLIEYKRGTTMTIDLAKDYFKYIDPELPGFKGKIYGLNPSKNTKLNSLGTVYSLRKSIGVLPEFKEIVDVTKAINDNRSKTNYNPISKKNTTLDDIAKAIDSSSDRLLTDSRGNPKVRTLTGRQAALAIEHGAKGGRTSKPFSQLSIVSPKLNSALFYAGDNEILNQSLAEIKERLYPASKTKDYKSQIKFIENNYLKLANEISQTKGRSVVPSELARMGFLLKEGDNAFPQDVREDLFRRTEGIRKIRKSISGLKVGTKSFTKICGLLKANGGTVESCIERFDKDPIGNTEKLSQIDNTTPALTKVKNAASTFLNVAKKGGRFGAFAAVGAAGAGLVKQFTSDDPTSYLSDENQQKNMLIDMVTEPVMEERDPGITSDAQLPVLGAVTAAGAIPGAAEYYKDRRGIRPNDKFTGPMKQGVGKIRAAASPISGLLGKGLAATGTPLGMLALEPLYLGQQLAEGDSIGEIATNPINYLGAAFASPLTQQATKFASPAVSNIMRLGISPTMLKTVSRRFGLPGLALSAGISGYEMYQNKKAGRGLFDDG
jgi:hypothetical protein